MLKLDSLKMKLKKSLKLKENYLGRTQDFLKVILLLEFLMIKYILRL